MIMKKRTYIQPEMETMVLPAGSLMEDLVLAGSGTMGTVGKNSMPMWRPKNPTRTPVF